MKNKEVSHIRNRVEKYYIEDDEYFVIWYGSRGFAFGLGSIIDCKRYELIKHIGHDEPSIETMENTVKLLRKQINESIKAYEEA
jgi:hypothetical protein